MSSGGQLTEQEIKDEEQKNLAIIAFAEKKQKILFALGKTGQDNFLKQTT